MYRQDIKELIKEQLNLLKEERTEEVIARFRENDKKLLAEFSINLNDTLDYYNTCDEDELTLLFILVVDLSNHFRTKELVDCVEKRISRAENQSLKSSWEIELGFIKSELKY